MNTYEQALRAERKTEMARLIDARQVIENTEPNTYGLDAVEKAAIRGRIDRYTDYVIAAAKCIEEIDSILDTL